jgi:hypothetical protein
MWDRLADNFPNAAKSTNVPSTKTTHPPPASHNTTLKKHTLSAPSNDGTLIDIIFVDIMTYDKIQVKPFINEKL